MKTAQFQKWVAPILLTLQNRAYLEWAQRVRARLTKSDDRGGIFLLRVGCGDEHSIINLRWLL